MKILVVGAGGVGGYFGAKLFEIGADVNFLLRNQRYELIKKNGLIVQSGLDIKKYFPKVYTSENLKENFDLIIIACKSYDLDNVIRSLNNIASNGIILPFLNGLDHIERLDQQYGPDRVMGGTANIAATVDSSGVIHKLTESHLLTIGHRTESQKKIAQDFFQLCKKADFISKYSEDIMLSLWEKWVTLSTLAASTTIFQCSIGKIIDSQYGKEIIEKAFNEACDIAKSNGYTIQHTAQIKGLEMLTSSGSTLTASMLRDWKNGLKTEHEHILASLIKQASTKNISCDLLKIAYTNLSINTKS